MEEIYAVLAAMVRDGECGCVATVIRAERSVPRHLGSKMIVRADGGTVGSVGGGGLEAEVVVAAAAVAAEGVCRRLDFDLTGRDGVCGGSVEVFLEPVSVGAPFVLFGAGHVGRALLAMGRGLPFRFTVIDDRPEFLSDLGPVATVRAEPGEWSTALQPTPRTFVLLANRNHELDGQALEALFAAEERCGVRCAWIGVIGSRGKARALRARFADRPERAARLEQVAIPAGAALGSETPHEIALSVFAEALPVARGVPLRPDDAGRPEAVWLQRRRPRDGGEGS